MNKGFKEEFKKLAEYESVYTPEGRTRSWIQGWTDEKLLKNIKRGADAGVLGLLRHKGRQQMYTRVWRAEANRRGLKVEDNEQGI